MEWLQAALSVVFIVTQVWLDLKLPDYMNEVTRLITSENASMSDIWRNGGYMLLCTLGSAASAIIVGFFAARIGSSFARRMRSFLFNKVESFSMEEINRFSTASLITRSTNDITQVQMLITMGLMVIVKAPITAVWAVTKIVGKGFEWTMATAGATGLLLVFIGFIIIAVFPRFRTMQTLTDNLTRVSRENLTGLRVIRAYNAEEYQDGKFTRANDEFTGVQLFTGRAMSLMMPVMTVVMSGLNLLINWIGAVVINGVTDAGGLEAQLTERGLLFSNMVVFSMYAMQVIMSFMMLVMIFIFLPRASVSAKRINEVLETEPAVLGGGLIEGNPELTGEVEFRNDRFRYPGAAEDVLRDVSFTAKRGETVAFIGSTGSGKSTLINLVPRFFDATEGEILIGGVNVRSYTLEALYRKIGYVPQKAALFRGTVAENVAYGDSPKGLDGVKAAAAIAQSADFIEAMEGCYEADVAQAGANLSGGQKQRLAIARAVCRKPELYIFDDSFSALDYKTDRLLRDALKRETAGVTSLIVAQRVGTVMDADRIVVLDEGRVVGIGTHRELLKTCAVYKEIAASQLSEEELSA
jgi:ATP-binding cassette subfamily B protein